MKKLLVIIVLVLVLGALVFFLSSCSYMSSNVIKMSGDEIVGHFASTPVNVTGKNIVISLYREMFLTWTKKGPRFANKVQIENDKEKRDIIVDRGEVKP